MADHVGELDDGNTGFELFDDESVAQIINLGTSNARDAEVAIDRGPDIADQERIAGFGDKEGSIFGFGAFFDIFFDGRLGGVVERYTSGVMRLKGADFEMRFLERDVLELEACELTDAKSCLEQELDDTIHTNIVFDTVAQGTIFERGEDAGGSYFVFGMADTGRWRGTYNSFAYQIFKK